tara:strand:+ start:3722 stop:4321 length:600 start_codon:yes stop_codon:yes gene_type:complete
MARVGEQHKLTEPSDEALILRVGKGDRTAYKMLVDRHLATHLAFAARLLGSNQDAEDVMQEAFVRIWKHAGNWDPARNAKFTTWFYRIVMNLCLDVLRKHKPGDDLENAHDVTSEEPSAEEEMDRQQKSHRLREALESLPERQKTAVVLCYLEELSNKEAAHIMGVSVNAMEALLVRARRKLATVLAVQRKELLEEIGK